MKLFNTDNVHIVNQCQLSFLFELPSVILPKRLIKFESAIVAIDRTFLLAIIVSVMWAYRPNP